MPILTSSELRAVVRAHGSEIEKSIITERLGVKTSFDVFLSHSYLDKEDVKGIYYLLTNLGFKVYVDWIVDPNLDRNNVTKATVEVIRARMKSSKSLIVAISDNANNSKWIPWELGFMDGLTQKCAIMPVSVNNNSTSFQGKEFFSVYPHIIQWENRLGVDKLWILEESKKYVVIDSWLKNNEAPYIRAADEVMMY